MSFKRYCDRCGAPINPSYAYKPISIGYEDSEDCKKYDLCVSCAYALSKFLKGEEKNEQTICNGLPMAENNRIYIGRE